MHKKMVQSKERTSTVNTKNIPLKLRTNMIILNKIKCNLHFNVGTCTYIKKKYNKKYLYCQFFYYLKRKINFILLYKDKLNICSKQNIEMES